MEDRRHWAKEEDDTDDDEPNGSPSVPTVIDEYRERAEAAERKLQEYIEAFKEHQLEHEQFRLRLDRDVERRVELQFASLVGKLLESADDLERAIEHARDVPEATSLVEGLNLALKRFHDGLEGVGVARISPEGTEFDPNEAEALRVDAVEDPTRHGQVTETLRPGYRLGEHVIRPARVAVGKHG